MKNPNDILNDLLMSEKTRHPNLDVFVRYETPTAEASIKYTDPKTGETLLVEFSKYDVDEAIFFKPADFSIKGKGIIIQEADRTEDGGLTADTTEEVREMLTELAVSGNVDMWLRICRSYIEGREELGIGE